MVNGAECQVYSLGKLKYLMINSAHTAESEVEIFTSWSVLNFQIKKNLNVAFKFSDVIIFCELRNKGLYSKPLSIRLPSKINVGDILTKELHLCLLKPSSNPFPSSHRRLAQSSHPSLKPCPTMMLLVSLSLFRVLELLLQGYRSLALTSAAFQPTLPRRS